MGSSVAKNKAEDNHKTPNKLNGKPGFAFWFTTSKMANGRVVKNPSSAGVRRLGRQMDMGCEIIPVDGTNITLF